MSEVILDLCGGTGSWSKPYQEAGYDVRVLTLPDYNINDIFCDNELQCVSVWNSTTKHWEYIPVPNIYGILSAPVCTMFSIARTTAKTPRDYNEGMILIKKCLEIIWFVRASNNSNLKFWALENPVGHLRKFLGVPPFSFEQWEFGDRGVKPTDIWGYFKKPVKTVLVKPDNITEMWPNGRISAVGWGNASREERAKTPPGFANAFYKANK